MHSARRPLSLVSGLFVMATLLVACTGGSTGPAVPASIPTASATGALSAPPVATTAVIPTAGGTVTLPAMSGVVAALTFAAGAPAGTTISATASTVTPANAPAPLVLKRAVAGVRKTKAVPADGGFFYITFSVSQAVPDALLTAVRLSGAVPVTAAAYAAEVDDITTAPGTALFTEAGSATSTSIAFGAPATAVQLLPGKTYLMQAVDQEAGVLPTTFVNNSGVANAYMYVVGFNPQDLSDPRFFHVTASGQLVPMLHSDGTADPTVPSFADADYSIPLPAAGAPFPLPLVRAGRIYVSIGAKMIVQIDPNNNWIAPDGWSNKGDPNFDLAWDWVEINYVKSIDSGLPGMGVNTTGVQMFGLPMSLTLTNSSGSGTQTSGYQTGARKTIMSGLAADPTFNVLIYQGSNPTVKPLRAISADNGVRNMLNNAPGGVPRFNPSIYAAYIAAVWKKYTTGTLTVNTSAFGTYTGQVNAQNQFVFTPDAAHPDQHPITVAFPSTTDVIIGNGTLFGQCMPPPPNPITADYQACGEIGSILSAAFNRSALLVDTTLYRNPPCPTPYLAAFYQNAPVNVYAKLIHADSLPTTDAPLGGNYGFGYDDNCNQSSVIADLANPSAMSITINPL